MVRGDGMDGIRRATVEAVGFLARPFLRGLERQQSAKLEELDVNNDGRVTRDELTKGLLGSGEASSMRLTDHLKAELLADLVMQRYDLDGDDAISVNPSLKRPEQFQARELKGLDTNRDGRVDLRELHAHNPFAQVSGMGGMYGAAYAAGTMRQFDLDHDGQIDVGT